MDHSPDMIELVTLRRELHAHAELAGQEAETSRIIRDFIEPHQPRDLATDLGGAGLAAIYEGREKGPSVMFRAEIDAVPVREIVAGLAAKLHRDPPRRGRVVLLFQPAEETGAGALSVLDDERFEKIAPDWIFALHNLPGENFGELQIKSGPFAAGSVGTILGFRGTTSHAAYPEQGQSPAFAVAELIQDSAGLPDSVDAGDGIARLTVIHARIGEAAFGTTPGEAEVMATLRSDREETLERLREEVVDQAQQISRAHGLELSHSWTDHFPVTTNHPEAVAMVEAVAEANGVAVALRHEAYPWSEDFGWFTRRFKGAIFGLGAGREHPALHSPAYDFPDDLIPVGIVLFEGLIERLLG